MKKLVSFLCILCLVIGCFCGCGNTSSSEAASSEDVVSVSDEVAAEVEDFAVDVEETAVEESTNEVESVEAVASVVEEAEPEPEPVVIEYPLEERTEISVFCPADSMAFMLMSNMGLSEDWNNVPTLSYVYDQINFEFVFETPSESGASEQFNLMIASGDWTDLFESDRYTGGATQALNDNVIIELTDLLQENAPDYWALLQEQSLVDQANAYTDDKQILSINDITAVLQRQSGLLMRKDMLDGLGLETPQTPDELYEALAAAYAEYGTDQTIYVGNDGILANVIGAFGCSGFDLSTNTADPGFYLEDGKVTASLISDSYYDYLQYFIRLYSEGLITSDFYSAVTTAASMDALSLGSAFIWSADGGLIDSMTATGQQEIEGYELCGIASITAEAGDTYHFASALSTVETDGTCISATCEDPETALKVLNWFFTEAGQTFCTWGVEDITYTTESGEPAFTEAVTDGFFPVNLMYGFYVWSPCAVYIDKSVLYSQYSDNMLSAYDLWSNDDAENTLPAGVSLTADESESYTGLIGDICTYASERLLKFIIGEEELNESAWADFGAELESMGINDCVEIYQGAYERYMGRVA